MAALVKTGREIIGSHDGKGLGKKPERHKASRAFGVFAASCRD